MENADASFSTRMLQWLNDRKFVILLCSFDLWTIFLHVRQLRLVLHVTKVPDVLSSSITQADFDTQRAQASFFVVVGIFSVASRMYSNINSYQRRYPSLLWKITGLYSTNSSVRAIIFSSLDEILSKIAVIPIVVVLAALQKANPLSVLLAGIIWMLSSALVSAVKTAIMIKLTDNGGPDVFLQIAIFFDSILLIGNYLFIEVFAPITMHRLPEGPAKTNIDALATKSMYYPRHQIYLEPNVKGRPETDPNAFHMGLFCASMIVVSETLMKAIGHNDIVAVVAHELGHWYYQHSLYGLFAGLVNTAFFTWCEIFCYGNDGINQYFNMDNSDPPHPLIPVMLFTKYIYPLFGGFLTGIHGTISYCCEFTADSYAVATGLGSELRRSLITILCEFKIYPIVDSWYAAWFRGHPSMIRRIERLS